MCPLAQLRKTSVLTKIQLWAKAVDISLLISAWYGHSFHLHHVTWTLQAAVPCQVLQCHHHPHQHFWWDRYGLWRWLLPCEWMRVQSCLQLQHGVWLGTKGVIHLILFKESLLTGNAKGSLFGYILWMASLQWELQRLVAESCQSLHIHKCIHLCCTLCAFLFAWFPIYSFPFPLLLCLSPLLSLLPLLLVPAGIWRNW
jgi:hypothetical protein